MEAFSYKWFTIYYLSLGLLLLTGGFYLLLKTGHFQHYLTRYAQADQPPPGLRSILKYFFLFTIPCLVLSLVPFSWIELLFSLWSLLVVFALGSQLVHWSAISDTILQKPEQVRLYSRLAGAMMMAVSLVMFALSYLVINRTYLL
jgi:hypothetical protein